MPCAYCVKCGHIDVLQDECRGTGVSSPAASWSLSEAELPLGCGERVTFKRVVLPCRCATQVTYELGFHSPSASGSLTLRPSRLGSSFPRRRDCGVCRSEHSRSEWPEGARDSESRVIQCPCFYLSKHKHPLACGDRVAHSSPVTPWLVIPAKAGLRRQYAGANICAANGPKGARQESRVIQCLCFYLFKHELPLAFGERSLPLRPSRLGSSFPRRRESVPLLQSF